MKEKRSGEKNILFIFPEDSVFKTKNKLDQGTSGIRRDLKQKNRRKLVEKRALSPWARHPSQKTSRISQSPLPKNQEKRSAWTATGTFLNVAVKKELHHSRFYSRATNTKIISVGSMLNPPQQPRTTASVGSSNTQNTKPKNSSQHQKEIKMFVWRSRRFKLIYDKQKATGQHLFIEFKKNTRFCNKKKHFLQTHIQEIQKQGKFLALAKDSENKRKATATLDQKMVTMMQHFIGVLCVKLKTQNKN